MPNSEDAFAQDLPRLQGLAHRLCHRSHAAYSWCDFGPDDLLQNTILRILKITRPAATGVGREDLEGNPLPPGFYNGVMRKVLLEMIRSSKLDRQLEPVEPSDSEGESREGELERQRDHRPLPDENAETEERRRLILQECMRYNDPFFTEVARKVLYEGYSKSEAFDETVKERGQPAHNRSTYFRWFSKIAQSLIKRLTKSPERSR
jgi:DNA-directed RNA polymerase specialized sigma24 family protein